MRTAGGNVNGKNLLENSETSPHKYKNVQGSISIKEKKKPQAAWMSFSSGIDRSVCEHQSGKPWH